MQKQNYKNKEFGLTIGFVLLGITVYQYFRHHHLYWGWFTAGSACIVLALTYPRLLSPLQKIWGKSGHLLGTVNGFILVFLIFFLILTPIAIVMRWTGKDMLSIRKRKTSYWQNSPPEQKKDMRLQY